MIDTVIPYGLNHKLADEYNRRMRESQHEWVLFVEHDVFVSLNPHWYEMCIEATKTCGPNVGLITCVTNGNTGRAQEPFKYIGKTPDLDRHVEAAWEIYQAKGNELTDATNKFIAGYFMLVNRKIWQDVQFKDQGKGVNKIDQDFCERLLVNGYKIKVMQGLYVYHRKGVRKLNWKK